METEELRQRLANIEEKIDILGKMLYEALEEIDEEEEEEENKEKKLNIKLRDLKEV